MNPSNLAQDKETLTSRLLAINCALCQFEERLRNEGLLLSTIQVQDLENNLTKLTLTLTDIKALK